MFLFFVVFPFTVVYRVYTYGGNLWSGEKKNKIILALFVHIFNIIILEKWSERERRVGQVAFYYIIIIGIYI